MADNRRWMVDTDGNSPEYFATREEADAYVLQSRKEVRECADLDGEWPDDTAIRVYMLAEEWDIATSGPDAFSDYEQTYPTIKP